MYSVAVQGTHLRATACHLPHGNGITPASPPSLAIFRLHLKTFLLDGPRPIAILWTTSHLGLVKAFLCFSYLGAFCLFCVFGVFSSVCFELSVPVQVIACKDSSLK